ncbi:MAG TPA: AMP-binding protein [Byssovorax sp.]|jgi:fatty-acyl-CoA synthase
MGLRERLETARRAAGEAWFRARTVAVVGRRIGMPQTVRLPGLRVLAREAAKGKVNASLVFRFLAENDPDRLAVVEASASSRVGAPRGAHDEPPPADRTLTFRELDARMEAVGAALASRGLKKGDAALILLKNRAEFLVLQPALNRIGVAAVTISWRSTAPEIEYIAKHAGVRAIFVDVDVAANVKAALANLDPRVAEHAYVIAGRAEGFRSYDDLVAGAYGAAPDASDEACVVMYTSGTTGKPKGAVRKFQKDALASALSVVGETPMVVRERHLAVCPLYHATAFGFTALSYLLQSTVVVLPEFRPEGFLDAVQRYRITTTALVPTMLHRILELGPDVIRKYDTSSLKVVFTGGAALSAPLAKDFLDAFGDVLWNFYGATETGIVTLASPDDLRASPGTIGHVVPGVELRLLDDAGNDVKDGDVGELYTRSSMLVEGYHADAGATNAAMREGFFSVGDLARRDARGCYHLEGRKRDMIISGGVNVYPAEVEQAIEEHPRVAEVAVVGVPDREWGERVRAFVVARKGASIDEGELKAHCKSRLAGPKIPRDFVVLDELPRNPTGKILKRELRERT